MAVWFDRETLRAARLRRVRARKHYRCRVCHEPRTVCPRCVLVYCKHCGACAKCGGVFRGRTNTETPKNLPTWIEPHWAPLQQLGAESVDPFMGTWKINFPAHLFSSPDEAEQAVKKLGFAISPYASAKNPGKRPTIYVGVKERP